MDKDGLQTGMINGIQDNTADKLKDNANAKLENRVTYDVIIIGAGMAGLLTAYYLQQEGKKVLVLEAKEIASGQTGRTTAKITSQHGMKYTELTDKIGVRIARLYAKANEEAIHEYEKLIKKESIECDFKRLSSYLYTRDKNRVGELKREADLATLFDIEAEYVDGNEINLPFETAGAVCFKKQAQFDADSFVKAIAGKVEVKEHAQVVRIKGRTVLVKPESIYTAHDIVITSHYPFKNFPGFYFLRQHQERSYVLALSGCKEVDGMFYGIGEDDISFRQKGDILLFGGSGRRTGEHTCADSYQKLLNQAKACYPEAKVEDMWSAQDCMPHDGIPFIGRYSIFTPHLYVVTGFQKWGMSTSMVAARLLCDEICGRENEYKEVFSPQRICVRAGWNNFIKDVGVSVKGLWNGFWHGLVKKEIPCCSHLGCGLHFNPQEETWECPCHGSRFDEEGNLRDNPAGKNIRGRGEV